MEPVKRRAILFPSFYDEMISQYAGERGISFTSALMMMLEMVRNDPRFAKSLPVKSAPAPEKPAEDFGPGYPWEGDPELDPRYPAPEHRIVGYKSDKRTAKQIIATEDRVLAKWPNAERVDPSDVHRQ